MKLPKPLSVAGLSVVLLVLLLVLMIELVPQLDALVPAGSGGLAGVVLSGITGWIAPNTEGFGPAAILFFDGLLFLTLLFFLLAFGVAQQRLALVQGVANTAWGLLMIIGGALVALFALAKLIGLITMMLAFPFGTIAYFVDYTCAKPPGQTAWIPPVPSFGVPVAGEACFDGTMAAIWLSFVLKLGVLLGLVALGWRYLTVLGLMILFALSGALSLGMLIALGWTSDWSFLLYPADAGITVIVAIVAILYGILTFIKGLFALALAIAGQVG